MIGMNIFSEHKDLADSFSVANEFQSQRHRKQLLCEFLQDCEQHIGTLSGKNSIHDSVLENSTRLVRTSTSATRQWNQPCLANKHRALNSGMLFHRASSLQALRMALDNMPDHTCEPSRSSLTISMVSPSMF